MKPQTIAALGALVVLGALAALPVGHTARDLAALLTLAAVAVASWEVTPGLALLVAYLPFRVAYESMAPSPMAFLPDVAVLSMTVRLLFLHPDDVLPLDAVEILSLAFAAVGLAISVHEHAHLRSALLELRDLLLFVLLYATVRRLAARRDGVEGETFWRLVPVALVAIAVAGAQAMVQTFLLGGHPFLLPGGLARSTHISAVNSGRPYGWIDNPNTFGELGFLALALLFAWARRQGGLRLVHLPAWAYFSLMLVLSFSRTAYLVALAVAVLALAVLPRPWEKAQVVGTVLGLAILVLLIPGARVRTVTSGPILQSAATVHRHPKTAGTSAGRRPSHPRHPAHRLARPTGLTVFSASYLAQSAKAGRLHNLRVALHLIRHHPLGTGLGTFGSSGAKAFHTNLKGLPKNFYADDNYIVILVETGVLGTLLFVALGVSVYARIARCRARPGDKALLAALFLATTLMALTGDTWEQLSLTVYPWMALGLLVGGAEGGGAFPARAKLPT